MILHVLIAMVPSWLQRQQQQVITYRQEGNHILKPILAAGGCIGPPPPASVPYEVRTRKGEVYLTMPTCRLERV
jgi:hypothetical protein